LPLPGIFGHGLGRSPGDTLLICFKSFTAPGSCPLARMAILAPILPVFADIAPARMVSMAPSMLALAEKCPGYLPGVGAEAKENFFLKKDHKKKGSQKSL
jgi:hypothetical protein